MTRVIMGGAVQVLIPRGGRVGADADALPIHIRWRNPPTLAVVSKKRMPHGTRG